MKSIKNIVFYGNRNTGMYVLSYIVARGYAVKVMTEDENVKKLASYYDLPMVTLDMMGEFDLFICCHGRKIIKAKYLQEGKFINIHPCLFKYKGHDPITKYIRNNDTIGSVEAHYMVEKVDAGEIIYREEFFTDVVKSHAEFYNIALPYYFNVIHESLKKLIKKISSSTRDN